MTGRRWAALAAVGLLLAFLGAFLLWPQRGRPAADSAEVVFLQQMIQHHRQAVDMGAVILQRAVNPSIRSVALDIQLSQEEQIRLMQGWLKLWHAPSDVPVDAMHAQLMGMASPEELESLKNLSVPEAETRFVQLMLRHHLGALSMVLPMQKPEVRSEVRLLARQMGTTQQGEVNTMQQLLARRGAQPLAFPAAPAHQHRP